MVNVTESSPVGLPSASMSSCLTASVPFLASVTVVRTRYVVLSYVTPPAVPATSRSS